MVTATKVRTGHPSSSLESPQRSGTSGGPLYVWGPWLLVACGLLAGSWLRLIAIFSKHQMEHDESVTYLAATGHMTSFEQAINGGLSGHWVAASHWQQLLAPGPFWSFREIASGLARYNEHPPLYFWLLHVWIAVFGMSLHVGTVLNVFIACATCLCLFGFASYVLASRWQAAAVAVAWAISPVTIKTSYMARHYDLFALVTVCCLWLFALSTDTRRSLTRRVLVLLALASGAGWLTHYQFALVLAAGGGLAVFRLVRRERRRLLLVLLAALAGALATAVVNPLFLVAIHNQRVQASRFTPRMEVERIENAVVGLSRFFIYNNRDTQGDPRVEALNHWLATGQDVRYLAIAALCLVALAVWVFVRLRVASRLGRRLRRADPGTAVPIYFLVAVGGLTVGMYLAFQSPSYAMAARYLAAVWPLVAFVPVLVGRLVRRWATVIALLICLLIILPSGIHEARTSGIKPAPIGGFAAASRVFISNQERGNLLPVIWELPTRVRVYVLPQADTYRDPSPWLGALRPGDVFVAVAGPMRPNLRAHVLDLLKQHFTLVPIKGKLSGASRMFRLEPQ